MLKIQLSLLLSIILTSLASAQSPIILSDSDSIYYIGKSIFLLEDRKETLQIEEVIHHTGFVKSKEEVPNLGVSGNYWGKFSIKNTRKNQDLLLVIPYPTIDEITLYSLNNEGTLIHETTGDNFKFSTRKIKHQNFIFELNAPINKTKTFFLKVKSDEQMLLPIYIGTSLIINEQLSKEDIVSGIFFGILIVMALYNFFLFFTIRDYDYLYYVLYVVFIAFTQATILGYTIRFIFPESPDAANQSLIIFVALAGISVFLFAFSFLSIDSYLPRLHKLKYVFLVPGIIAIFTSLIGHENIGSIIADYIAIFLGPSLLFIVTFIALKGERSAIYFLAGWTIAFIGFAVYSLRNIGMLPFSNFTNHTMQFGIAIETVIFSFALADRIRILKKENEKKQNEIIRHLQEKEKNIMAVKQSEVLVEKLKKETLSSQFESLKNQVNPHFLFNSLNVLTELIYQNQHMAAKFVKELSDVYRYVLDSKNKEVIDLNSELKFVEAFIYLLKIRYNNGLVIDNRFKGTSKMTIPPLAIQLLLENAIKHNIISERDPLTISIFYENDFIVVKNNLNKKTTVQKSSGIGIKNLENRYAYLTDKKIIISQENNYFIVKIPILSFSQI